MSTIAVLDAAGNPQSVEAPNPNGRAADTASSPVVLSTQDLAALNLRATEATLASVLAKLTADPSTATGVAAVNTSVGTAITALAAILAKLSADPATQTTAAAILAKLSADPATQTTLAAVLARLPTALLDNRLRIAMLDASGNALGTTTNPVYTSPTGAPVTLVDKSGTITTGGTQQTLAAANSARRGLWVQNNSAGDLRINSTGNASSTSGLLLPGGQNAYYAYPSSGVPVTAISIWGATTGQAFEAREW